MASRLALLSVFNKDGAVEFAKGLLGLDFDIMASGGTARVLAGSGLPVTDVEDLVGGEAILGHRVVTLSRELYAAILATESKEDVAELERLGIRRIDLICVDMYPLRGEINNPSATLQSVIERTDVGGPTMLHAGAKGQRIVICDPKDCKRVLEWLQKGMPKKETFIRTLAAKAEFTVAEYIFDSARYHGNGIYEGMVGKRTAVLRYGENPHQAHAALYMDPGAKDDWFAPDKFELVGGANPSFINMTDLDRLITTMVRLRAGFKCNNESLYMAIAVKHGNVCGVGCDLSSEGALSKMIKSDPESLFGGCVLVNFSIDGHHGSLLRTLWGERVLDMVVAPTFTACGQKRLSRKNQRCRMFRNPTLEFLGETGLPRTSQFRPLRGGFLLQDPSLFVLEIPKAWKESINDCQQTDVIIAWAIGSTSDSNSIVIVKDGMLLGRGLAQPSRVLACKVAVLHAKENGHAKSLPGAVVYSDSFFPFSDGPEVLAKDGIKVIFATSGSVRDEEVQEFCRKSGITLLQLPDGEARGFFGH